MISKSTFIKAVIVCFQSKESELPVAFKCAALYCATSPSENAVKTPAL